MNYYTPPNTHNMRILGIRFFYTDEIIFSSPSLKENLSAFYLVCLKCFLLSTLLTWKCVQFYNFFMLKRVWDAVRVTNHLWGQERHVKTYLVIVAQTWFLFILRPFSWYLIFGKELNKIEIAQNTHYTPVESVGLSSVVCTYNRNKYLQNL